jgi:membrane-bound lytic murein transglycosylase A
MAPKTRALFRRSAVLTALGIVVCAVAGNAAHHPIRPLVPLPLPRPQVATAPAAAPAPLPRVESIVRGETPASFLPTRDRQLEPVAWGEVDGWAGDDHAASFKTFLASCRPLARARTDDDPRPMFAALRNVCRRAIAAGEFDDAKARQFFETNFRPVWVAKLDDTDGFLTGYYEPIVDGSRFPNPEFHTPIYRKPPDLSAPGYTEKSDNFPNRGPVFRRVGNKTEPYPDRGAIEDGLFDGKRYEIAYLRSSIDLLFIQIQGSAQIRLEDGVMMRVNYAAHNGWPYTPVGRVLIDRGVIPRDQMSMQRIRAWMSDHPEEAKDVRRANRSYVFFRIVSLSTDQEASGAQGIPLTPGRSIAVDAALHVYGTPFFISADLPIDSDKSETKFSRLMIAQDTGSAITGPARADLFWGAGDQAGKIAGRIRNRGRFVMLVPNEIDPFHGYGDIPPPRARPDIPAAPEGPVPRPVPEASASVAADPAPASAPAVATDAPPTPRPRPVRPRESRE